MADEMRLWSDVFHHAAFGISIIDPATDTISLVNETFAILHGMSVDNIQGLTVSDVYAPSERERVASMQATSDRNGYVDYEADRVRKDGSTFPAHIHVTSVRQPNGEVRYRIATVQEITSQRRAESERMHAEVELKQASSWAKKIGKRQQGTGVICLFGITRPASAAACNRRFLKYFIGGLYRQTGRRGQTAFAGGARWRNQDGASNLTISSRFHASADRDWPRPILTWVRWSTPRYKSLRPPWQIVASR